jgi:hypothetical protein
VSPLRRNSGLSENGFYGTFWHACIAINAGLGIDDKHVIVEVKGFDRTNESTVSITTVHAGFSYHIGHEFSSPEGDIICCRSCNSAMSLEAI